MAVTKIWAIHDSVSRVVDYCTNPSKTKLSDLEQVLLYAADKEKTLDEGEQQYAVTGIGCRAESAAREMAAVQRRFGKDAAQSHSLGFAAGKFQSVFVFQFPQAHIPNEIVASVFVIQARIPAFNAGKVGTGDVYVPFQRHIESVTCLGHITDCIAAAREVRFKNRVFVGFYQAADNFEHGGFSRSVGTDDRVAFSFFENQSADV